MGAARLRAVAAFASLGGLLFGYDVGVVSGVKFFANFERHFGLEEGKAADTAAIEWFVSIVLLGAAAGALVGSLLADRFGRRWTVFAGAAAFNVFTLGTCLAQEYWALLLTRFLVGVGIGVLSLIVPMFLVELSPAESRGTVATTQIVGIVLGILISNLVNILVQGTTGSDWRLSIGLGMVFSLPLNAGALLLPESPRWLLSRGERAQALATLEALRAPGEAAEELAAVERAMKEEDGVAAAGWLPVVRTCCSCSGHMTRRLWTGVLLHTFNEIGGIDILVYYAPEIFRNMGEGDPLIITAVIGGVNLLGTLAALWLNAKVDHKPLLQAGAALMLVFMSALAAIVGVYASKDGGDMSQGAAMAALVMFLLYVAAFAMSWGPLAWVVTAEIFPFAFRAKGNAIATFTNWMANFVVARFALAAVQELSYGLYAILAAVQLAMMLFARYALVETRGKTLEEIDLEYRESAPRAAAHGDPAEAAPLLGGEDDDLDHQSVPPLAPY